MYSSFSFVFIRIQEQVHNLNVCHSIIVFFFFVLLFIQVSYILGMVAGKLKDGTNCMLPNE